MRKLIEIQSINGLLSTRTKRIVLAMVIFMSMLINSFVPKSIENKESLIAIMGAVVSNVIVETFKQCNDTLTEMSNKITKDLYKYLRLGEVGTDVPVNRGKKEGENPVNTSSDNGIEITSREYKEILKYIQEEGIVVISEGKIKERLYRLYNKVKEYCSISNKLGVVFFILFIVAIRSRKEEIARIIKREIEDKTNSC